MENVCSAFNLSSEFVNITIKTIKITIFKKKEFIILKSVFVGLVHKFNQNQFYENRLLYLAK